MAVRVSHAPNTAKTAHELVEGKTSVARKEHQGLGRDKSLKLELVLLVDIRVDQVFGTQANNSSSIYSLRERSRLGKGCGGRRTEGAR